MEVRSLRAQWANGESTVGGWLSLREPLFAEVAGTAGYDYVCLDMQHGLMSIDDVRVLIHAMAHTPTVPLVRVPWNEPGVISHALDAGALGVIVPMVNTADEARAAVSACRYAPTGSRSFGPVIPNSRFGRGFYAQANDTIAVIPMIETAEALANIDDILSVPGVDAIYVGPTDLSLSLGLAPLMDHDGGPFNEALATIVAACHRHGVVPGIHANPDLAARRHQQGFRMLSVGYEIFAAIQALRDGAAAKARLTS